MRERGTRVCWGTRGCRGTKGCWGTRGWGYEWMRIHAGVRGDAGVRGGQPFSGAGCQCSLHQCRRASTSLCPVLWCGPDQGHGCRASLAVLMQACRVQDPGRYASALSRFQRDFLSPRSLPPWPHYDHTTQYRSVPSSIMQHNYGTSPTPPVVPSRPSSGQFLGTTAPLSRRDQTPTPTPSSTSTGRR